MEKTRGELALVLLSALIIFAVPMAVVEAQETLIWGPVDLSSSNPLPLTTPFPLEAGVVYRIEAKGWFISCDPVYGWVVRAMDPQYYTEELFGVLGEWGHLGSWAYPVLASPSILQINGMDVYWGPFSNGGATWGDGHQYSINYVGTGAPIAFTIVDPDGNYEHNYSHFIISIYQTPQPPRGETAYAYGGDYATCFLSQGFKQWGWTNGPLGHGDYEFEIWAGAAKCDLSKGELVGTLTIHYEGTTATFTYEMNSGWTMGYTHVYAGSEMFPRDAKGDFTVAPGQYTSIHYVDGVTDTHTITGLSGGPIWVIAHAGVFEV